MLQNGKHLWFLRSPFALNLAKNPCSCADSATKYEVNCHKNPCIWGWFWFFFFFILVHAEKEIIVFVLILGSEVICRRWGVNKKSWGRKGSLGQKQLLSGVSQSMGPAALSRHFSSVLSLLLIYGCGRRGLLAASARGSWALSQDCGHAPGHVWEGARRHPWGKCPPCLHTVLTPRCGVHPRAMGAGSLGETWSLCPRGKWGRKQGK